MATRNISKDVFCSNEQNRKLNKTISFLGVIFFSLSIIPISTSLPYLFAAPVTIVSGGGGNLSDFTASTNSWSGQQTFEKIVVSSNTSTFNGATLRMGATDDSARSSLHHFGPSSILKLGASDADSSADSNVNSEGIVVYHPTSDKAARVKADRFGLTLDSDQNNGYYFRADATEFYYSTTSLLNVGFGTNNPLAKVHIVSGVTGSGLRPSDAYSLAELQVSTPTVTPMLVIDSANFDVWIGSCTSIARYCWRNARTGLAP